MGSKVARKGGIKPKRDVETPRPKQSKQDKKSVKPVKEQEPELELNDDESEESEEEEQLGGFSSTDESEGDESEVDESEEDEESEQEEQESEEDEIKPTKKESKKQESHEVKALPKQNDKSSKKSTKITKGTIYIGRLPDGFEEKELKQYFNQFGDITNISLPRNKKTGRSKHFGFLEFSNIEDAKVAQDTMNNYLLLNHQLKVELVDEEFKSSKKFKKDYFRVSKLKKDVQTLNKKVQDKRSKRAEALKSAGIDF